MHALEPAWEALKRDFDSACAEAALEQRGQITASFNQTFRRFRHYANESDWMSAMLDAASRFATEVAIFTHKNGALRLAAQEGLNLGEDLEFPASTAAAFVSAIESRDPVVALRRASEVTESLSGGERNGRAHLFPVANGARVVAVLFAAGRDLDGNALELITGMAAAVLERHSNQSIHSQIAPVSTINSPIENANTPHLPSHATHFPSLPAWADLPALNRELHVKAQRFSRVTVAEMQLARPEACRAGREQSNLYTFLQKEIDKARDTYRKQFMTIPSMVDYLHLELVDAAAEGSESRLGADYPGQLA